MNFTLKTMGFKNWFRSKKETGFILMIRQTKWKRLILRIIFNHLLFQCHWLV